MRKIIKYRFLFLMLVVTSSVVETFGQNRTIDSLKLVLKNLPLGAKHDTTRCNILNQLVEQTTDEQRPIYIDKLKTIVEKNLKLYPPNNSQHKVFKKILGDALYNIGTLYASTGDFRMALENLVKSLKISEEFGDKNGVAQSLNNIGFIYNSMGNIPLALEYYEKSLKSLEEIGDKTGIATSLNNIGFIHKSQGDIPRALDYFGKSLKIQESIGDKYGIAGSLDNIGLIYQSQGDNLKAFDYFGKELKICEEIGDKLGISASVPF